MLREETQDLFIKMSFGVGKPKRRWRCLLGKLITIFGTGVEHTHIMCSSLCCSAEAKAILHPRHARIVSETGLTKGQR